MTRPDWRIWSCRSIYGSWVVGTSGSMSCGVRNHSALSRIGAGFGGAPPTKYIYLRLEHGEDLVIRLPDGYLLLAWTDPNPPSKTPSLVYTFDHVHEKKPSPRQHKATHLRQVPQPSNLPNLTRQTP